jgi:hypothetical protein
MSRAFIARRARRYFCASRRESTSFAICVAGVAALIAYSAAGRAADKVTVKLTGEIAPECSISNESGSMGIVNPVGKSDIDVSQPGSAVYSFVLNCNAPFAYRLEALNGALAQTGNRATNPSFTQAVPYRVAMQIATGNASINDSCAGEELRMVHASCAFTDSGDAIAINSKANLTIAWSPPVSTPVAGEYHEQIKIFVLVRM